MRCVVQYVILHFAMCLVHSAVVCMSEKGGDESETETLVHEENTAQCMDRTRRGERER